MAGIPPAALAEGIKAPGQEQYTQEPAVTPTLAQAQVISRVPFSLPGSRLTGAKPGLPSLTPGTQTQPQGRHKLCHELIPGHVARIQTQTLSRAPRCPLPLGAREETRCPRRARGLAMLCGPAAPSAANSRAGSSLLTSWRPKSASSL